MALLKIIVLIVHIMVCLGLIMAVLLHSGKGGGIAGVLGGASGSLFTGSYIVEKNLDRITIVLSSTFAVTTFLLIWMMAPKSA